MRSSRYDIGKVDSYRLIVVGKKRNDMPWTEEKLYPEFENFIKGFREDQLPQIYDLLEKYSGKHTVIFRSREETDSYLNDLRGTR